MLTLGWMVGVKQLVQRQRRFREAYLKNAEGVRSSTEARSAVAFCAACIENYEEWFVWNEGRWSKWQKVIILGGVIATLSGVLSVPPEWVSFIKHPEALSWIRGVPAAIVTIAASYLSSFTYREDAARQCVTAEALWNELAKYLSKARPYNDVDEQADTGEFLTTICQIMEAESHNWRALVLSTKPKDDDGDKKDGKSRDSQH